MDQTARGAVLSRLEPYLRRSNVDVADRHLPTVPSPTPGSGAGSTGVEHLRAPGSGGAREPGGPEGSGDAEGRGAAEDGSGGGRGGAHLVGAVLLAGGLILVLGVAALVGEAVRNAVLVEVDGSFVGSRPSYSDAPAEAAAFFARRDTVQVRVPRDMTVAEFLSLYHLETNAVARAALREQLGAVTDADVLREGDQVTLTITVPRVER